MKPGPFTYHDPGSVADVVSLLATHEDVKLLAGGQSLMPMMNMRFVVPDHVIDLNGVGELAGITDDGDALTIGAMTRQRDIRRSDAVAAKLPLAVEALGWVGHFQTRNRGTIGGSLSHLDPAAELPLVAAATDAVLTVAGPDGNREVPFAEWPLAYMMPSIGPDEVLTAIRLPVWQEPHGSAFIEFARRHGDFAIVSVAALLAVSGGRITRAVIAIGGADTAPIRLTETEAALVGAEATAATFAEAGAAAKKIDAMSDAYVSSAYRQRLAGVLTERALAKAAARAAGGN
jgi:aerobic carbon-monoxide dehydrogenase medium subunit